MHYPCHQILTTGQGEQETKSLPRAVSGRGSARDSRGQTERDSKRTPKKGSCRSPTLLRCVRKIWMKYLRTGIDGGPASFFFASCRQNAIPPSDASLPRRKRAGKRKSGCLSSAAVDCHEKARFDNDSMTSSIYPDTDHQGMQTSVTLVSE